MSSTSCGLRMSYSERGEDSVLKTGWWGIHTDISGRMIIEGHNLRGHFLVAFESSPAVYFTSEMQLKHEVLEVRRTRDVVLSEQSHP